MSTPRTAAAPSVSVLIPTYNRSDFLQEAIATAYAQTVLPDQVIVVNDGSTDNTEDCLRSLASELPSSFVWRTTPNGGAARARNVGLQLVTGQYVGFLDSDDLWHPQKLERQLAHFAADPDLAMSFTGYTYTSRGYRETPGRNTTPAVIRPANWNPDPDLVLEQCLYGRFPIGPMSVVLIRRDALLRVTPFDEGLHVASDLAMYLEFLIRRMKMDYLPADLVEYRWHGANVSRDVGIVWDDLSSIYDRFFRTHGSELPTALQGRTRSLSAHWHLQTAIDAIRHGDKRLARRHVASAARARPLSIRPGWVRMLGIGSPPAGPWPSDVYQGSTE